MGATSTVRRTPYTKLERISLLVSIAAVLPDAPSLVDNLGVVRFVPGGAVAFLRRVHPYPGFWKIILVFLTLGFVVRFLVAGWKWSSVVREEPDSESQEKESLLLREKAIRGLRFGQFKAVVLSLGLVLLRKWVLQRFGVALYGTFSRKRNQWAPEPTREDAVDRLYFHDKRGIEVQYSALAWRLHVRRHGVDSSTYIDDSKGLSCREKWLLLVASNYFWWWVVRRPIKLFLLIAAVCLAIRSSTAA